MVSCGDRRSNRGDLVSRCPARSARHDVRGLRGVRYGSVDSSRYRLPVPNAFHLRGTEKRWRAWTQARFEVILDVHDLRPPHRDPMCDTYPSRDAARHARGGRGGTDRDFYYRDI